MWLPTVPLQNMALTLTYVQHVFKIASWFTFTHLLSPQWEHINFSTKHQLLIFGCKMSWTCYNDQPKLNFSISLIQPNFNLRWNFKLSWLLVELLFKSWYLVITVTFSLHFSTKFQCWGWLRKVEAKHWINVRKLICAHWVRSSSFLCFIILHIYSPTLTMVDANQPLFVHWKHYHVFNFIHSNLMTKFKSTWQLCWRKVQWPYW